LLTVTAVVAALLLAGCGGGSVRHGTITAKAYVPASSRIQRIPVYTSHCTETTHTTRSHGHTTRHTTESCHRIRTGTRTRTVRTPACYRLYLRKSGRTGTVCVTAHQYATARVGGTW